MTYFESFSVWSKLPRTAYAVIVGSAKGVQHRQIYRLQPIQIQMGKPSNLPEINPQKH